jgi:hypothetical protein
LACLPRRFYARVKPRCPSRSREHSWHAGGTCEHTCDGGWVTSPQRSAIFGPIRGINYVQSWQCRRRTKSSRTGGGVRRVCFAGKPPGFAPKSPTATTCLSSNMQEAGSVRPVPVPPPKKKEGSCEDPPISGSTKTELSASFPFAHGDPDPSKPGAEEEHRVGLGNG